MIGIGRRKLAGLVYLGLMGRALACPAQPPSPVAPSGQTPQAPPGSETADNTTATAINVSPTPGAFQAVSPGLMALSIIGGQVAVNGVVFTHAAVATFFYINRCAYRTPDGTNWFGPITPNSPGYPTPVGVPQPHLVPFLNSVSHTAAAGASCGFPTCFGGTPTGISSLSYLFTWVLSGPNTSRFQFSPGSNLIVTQVANIPIGTYAATVTATPISGHAPASLGPLTLPINLQVT